MVQPLPPAPVLPIAPVAPITPEVAPEPIPEDKPKKTVKSRAKKEKAVTEKTTVSETEETEKGLKEVAPIEEEKKEEEKKQEEKAEVKTVQEISPKGTLMDMSFLLKEVKPVLQKSLPAPVPAPLPVPLVKAQEEEKTADTKPSAKAEQKTQKKPQSKKTERVSAQKPVRQQTAEERLQEAFLTRLRKLGGAYFEYYSVYLLERYARRNGRRLEGLKITGGEHDGGIDGEIELTDRLGFRETIYIQAKNWNPDKGDEKYWVVGETLLQQFIGACVCRQSKDKKQHCRGIFITTSRFTPEAQRILADTSDKFVGYDGADLFEVAQECEFGLIRKNGVWVLDEELLSGEKAFFRAF